MNMFKRRRPTDKDRPDVALFVEAAASGCISPWTDHYSSLPLDLLSKIQRRHLKVNGEVDPTQRSIIRSDGTNQQRHIISSQLNNPAIGNFISSRSLIFTLLVVLLSTNFSHQSQLARSVPPAYLRGQQSSLSSWNSLTAPKQSNNNGQTSVSRAPNSRFWQARDDLQDSQAKESLKSSVSSQQAKTTGARILNELPNKLRGGAAWSLRARIAALKLELEKELSLKGRSGSNSNESPKVENQTGSENISSEQRQVTLGAPCLVSSDCSNHIQNSHCKTDNFECTCLPQHVEFNATTCLPPSLLGFGCILDSQCQRKVPSSICRHGTCACPAHLFAYRRDKCLSASKLDDYCLSDKQCEISDRHSFCKWRIPHVYGVCKCPPNYKILTGPTNSSSSQRCVPRLGDSCLDDDECQLATSNSVCRDPQPSTISSWTTSSASSKRCTCSPGFTESTSRLLCERPVVQETSVVDTKSKQKLTANGQSAATPEVWWSSSNQPLDEKNHYELLGPAREDEIDKNRNESLTSKPEGQHELQLTNLGAKQGLETSGSKPESANVSQASKPEEATLRGSSLGKPCSSSKECQLVDTFSECVGGRCECLEPSSSCSSNRTGCQAGTFQCRSGQCISWYFVCDQLRNCDDGSDEENCTETSECPPEAFDCSRDLISFEGSKGENGSNYWATFNTSAHWEPQSSSSYAKLRSCVSRSRLCDGRPDCPNGSDEYHCSSNSSLEGRTAPLPVGGAPCHPQAFTCASGQCLPAYVFCNAVLDCADGSDEPIHLCERPLATPPHSKAPALPPEWPHLAHEKAGQGATMGVPLRATDVGGGGAGGGQDSPLIRTNRSTINQMLVALGLRAASLAIPQTGSGTRKARSVASEPRALRNSRLLGGFSTFERPLQTGSGDSGRAECPADAFSCRNGRCRSSAVLCSGVDGCGDNSDEQRCQVCKCPRPRHLFPVG